MRSAVNAVVSASAALAALAAFPVGALAAEGRAGSSGQEGADRWVPSLAITSHLSIQSWDGAVASEICEGCTLPSPSAQMLRPSVSDSTVDVTPFLGASLELMSPELPVRTRPRFFISGEVAAAFGTDRTVALEGDPGELRSPLSPENTLTTGYSENAAQGQGSDTTATLQDLIFRASAGIAFPVTFRGRAMRIKPSLSWVRYGVDVGGLVVDAQCRPTATSTQCNDTVVAGVPQDNGFQREVRLAASQSETYNGIGPGIDIEMDTGRFGPLGSALFLSTRFYRILGNRSVDLSDTQSYTDELSAPGTDEAGAEWGFEVDDWMYQVGIGMRFQWLGSDR